MLLSYVMCVCVAYVLCTEICIIEPFFLRLSHLILLFLVGWKRFPNPTKPIIIPSKPGRFWSPATVPRVDSGSPPTRRKTLRQAPWSPCNINFGKKCNKSPLVVSWLLMVRYYFENLYLTAPWFREQMPSIPKLVLPRRCSNCRSLQPTMQPAKQPI